MIWNTNNFTGFLCEGSGKCPKMTGKRHKTTARQGRNKTSKGYYGECHNTDVLNQIPHKLCLEIAKSCGTF